MEDRRKYRRIVKCFMIWLKFRQRIKEPVYPKGWDIVTTHDLGAGGILFNYDMPVEIGTEIRLRIIFPFKKKPIDCIGRVIRDKQVNSDKYSSICRVAAQFDSISEPNKGLIDKVANEVCA